MSLIIKLFVILILLSTVEVLLTWYFKSPSRLGKVLEKNVAKSLSSLEKEGVYGKALRNIYLPKNEYETSEIDVLYLTTVGAFLIECKNYKGWIFGDEKNINWTVSLPSGRGRSEKHPFMNPIMQNSSHIKPLKNVFKNVFPEKNIFIYPVVVFSDRGELKKVHFSDDHPVIYSTKVKQYIEHVIKECDPILTQVQVDELYEKILPYTRVDREVKRQHIANIKK